MRKSSPQRNRAPLFPIPVQSAFYRLAIGPFPETHNGNRYIVVMLEYLTRWPKAFAVPRIDAVTIANVLIYEILPRHGAPCTLLLD